MTQALSSLGHQVRLLVPRPNAAVDHTPAGNSPDAINAIAASDPSWQEIAHHYGLVKHNYGDLAAGPTPEFSMIYLPSNPRFKRYDFSLQALRWARRWGAEIVYTRLPQSAAIGSELGIPIILEVHDVPQGRTGPWLFYRFLKGKGARRLVVITQSLARDLNQAFGISLPGIESDAFTLVAPDGVDLMRYQDVPSPQAARAAIAPLLPERFTAGYSGHLYSGRGIHLLLDLAARLPSINLLLVGGEPSDVARLREQASQRQLNNLVITGFVPNADLPRYQAACDVLLMPYQEHVAGSSGGDIARYLSPMKVFEYMACGRPILSSSLPVLREVLNEHNALLLPADDVRAWATTLTELQANPESGTRLAAQARADAQLYTWESRAERVLTGLATGQASQKSSIRSGSQAAQESGSRHDPHSI